MNMTTFSAGGAAWAKAWRPECKWSAWQTGNHLSGYNKGSGLEDGSGEKRWGKIVKGFECQGREFGVGPVGQRDQ